MTDLCDKWEANGVLDDFSLKGRIIAVLGGAGLLGRVAKETIAELDGKAISIEVKSWADYVCNVATNFVRLHQIAHNRAYSGIINCAIRNYRPVTAPINDDPQTESACTHTVPMTSAPCSIPLRCVTVNQSKRMRRAHRRTNKLSFGAISCACNLDICKWFANARPPLPGAPWARPE